MSQLSFDEAGSKAMEAVYVTPDLIAQRARVLDLLAPTPGEAVLDIGVGPGLLAFDLARLVGAAGRVAGLDTSPDMLAMAAPRLANFPHAELVQADATALPFEDGAFDAAVSTQVYEYVADMPKALAELHRVLRPGGRALILDSDWRSVVWASSDQARMDRILTCWDDHLADPHLPGRLGPMLRRAGFEVRRVEITPMLAPRWQPQGYAAGMMRMIHQFALDHGARHGISREEADAWRADQQRLIDADEFFFSLNRYIFVATR